MTAYATASPAAALPEIVHSLVILSDGETQHNALYRNRDQLGFYLISHLSEYVDEISADEVIRTALIDASQAEYPESIQAPLWLDAGDYIDPFVELLQSENYDVYIERHDLRTLPEVASTEVRI